MWARRHAAAFIVTRWRNIILTMALASFCRKSDEHTEDGKYGDLHALLRRSTVFTSHFQIYRKEETLMRSGACPLWGH
jgi:hypothetical protein